MSRHGLIVEVAEIVGTEPAIVEATLAYRAERFGKKDGDRLVFTVDISELEKCYGYFSLSVEECFDLLDYFIDTETDIPEYVIEIAELHGSRFAIVSASAEWVSLRKAF